VGRTDDARTRDVQPVVNHPPAHIERKGRFRNGGGTAGDPQRGVLREEKRVLLGL
jgi:hypothetical protein